MITAADADYHASDPSEKTWAETIVCVFSVPEAQILGNAYLLCRPNVGTTISSVIVHSGFCEPHTIDFVDPQVHVPAPAAFSDCALSTGLSFTATNAPRDFHVKYEHVLGECRFDLQFTGLHDPFDVHDPDHNPLISAPSDEIDTGLGDVWAFGHYDMIGHITGTLELRGKTYEVDCYDGMDRSWGPRAEVGNRAASWLHVTFGREFGLHLGMALGWENGEITYTGFRFGYVVENGQMYGIKSATVEAARDGLMAMSNHIIATDSRGVTHEFYGSAVGGAPWYSFSPAYVSAQMLMRYESGGRVGYAEHTDVLGTEFLAAATSRHGRLQQLSHR